MPARPAPRRRPPLLQAAAPTPAARAVSGATDRDGGLGITAGDDTLHLTDFFAQGVDARDSSLALRFGDRGVSTNPSPARYLASSASTSGEALIDPLPRSGLRSSRDRAHRGDRGAGTLDVGVEVPQVGMAEDVLLAGDLWWPRSHRADPGHRRRSGVTSMVHSGALTPALSSFTSATS